MYLAYGSYTHDANEADISITRTPRLNDANQVIGYTERWVINGELHNTGGQAAITTEINALIAAYSVNGQNLRLLLDDGSTVSAHALLSNNSLSGTRVVAGPSFPGGKPAEYSTFRSYAIEVEADFALNQGNPLFALVTCTEILSLTGGGPLDIHVETANTVPVKQRVRQETTYRAVQDGRAVGRFSYPPPAPPIFPADEVRPARDIRRASPERRDNGAGVPVYENFEVLWHYEFASATPLVAFPTVWL